MHMIRLKHIVLYTGVAILMTHELDAVMNNEWRVLPVTSWLNPEVGYAVFLWAHVPLFALIISLLANSSDKVKTITSNGLAVFLIVHGSLHFAFMGHEHYEFSSVSSNLLIYGGALFGFVYIAINQISDKSS